MFYIDYYSNNSRFKLSYIDNHFYHEQLLWISPRLLSDLSGIRPFYPA